MGGMAELLDDDAIASALTDLPGWERAGDALVLIATLPTFPAAIGVVDRVAEIAEARDHHPDIDIRWTTITFRLSSHSAGGITDRDADMCGRIDAIVDERVPQPL